MRVFSFDCSVQPAFTCPGAKVLLAEDMHISQETFRKLVTPWRFEVAFASNGAEAVEMARKESYQMIFLDQMMPEMTGDEAAVKIREFSDVPIIMMTADISDDMRSEYLKRGFADFVPKPIEFSTLQRIIETYMPGEYRHVPVSEETRGISPDGCCRKVTNKRTLETFIHEVELIAEELPACADENLELFRIKVHGIKGASRGIGKIPLGEQAEIMEMAAKAENLKFIHEHMEDLLKEVRETVREAYEELKAMPDLPKEHEDGTIDKKQMFARLKEGFDNYQLAEVEYCIRLLEEAVLTAEERELLLRVKAACEELDYEEGSALFR